MKTVDYLDRIKAKAGVQSDYAIAKVLGVSRNTVSNWRTGSASPDLMMCYEWARRLGDEPALLVANIEQERAERSGRDDVASGWGQWIERLGGVAAVIAVAVILSVLFGNNDPTGGAAALVLALGFPLESVYYVNCALALAASLSAPALGRRLRDLIPRTHSLPAFAL